MTKIIGFLLLCFLLAASIGFFNCSGSTAYLKEENCSSGRWGGAGRSWVLLVDRARWGDQTRLWAAAQAPLLSWELKPSFNSPAVFNICCSCGSWGRAGPSAFSPSMGMFCSSPAAQASAPGTHPGLALPIFCLVPQLWCCSHCLDVFF